MLLVIPKSKVLVTSADPLERLRTEVKDFTKIQPLALRGEITTWQYDAKNCIALHYRMVDNNVWSRELFEAIGKWVARLLNYASALGFEEQYPASLCKGRPNVLQGYYYLTQELRRIRVLEWSSQRVQRFHMERRVDPKMLEAQSRGRCALHHNALSGYDYAVRYRCRLDGVEQNSAFCGSNSLKRLVKKINKAAKKHRNPAYREGIMEKMRSKEYVDRQLRPGLRKA
jgi:hypothetical protein